MLAMDGSVLLGWKTVDPVSARARTAARVFGVVTAILFVAAGFWVAKGLDGFTVTSAIHTGPESNPLSKTVAWSLGSWMANYDRWPIIRIAPCRGVAGAFVDGGQAVGGGRGGLY